MNEQYIQSIEQRIGMPLKKYLHEEYTVKELSLEEIANNLGVSRPYVWNLCKRYRIPTRKITWNKGLTKSEMQEIIQMNKEKLR